MTLARPRVAMPVILAVLSLLCLPLAWVAWAVAEHELHLVRCDRLALDGALIRGEGWLVFARGLALALTILSLVAIAIVIGVAIVIR